MHSGIITADISDHFIICLISKYLILDSSNESIHNINRKINYNLFSIIDWKHAVNQIPLNYACNKILGIFFGLYNKTFPKKMINK